MKGPPGLAAKTVGVVIRPRWFSRVNLTVDYIDIALDSAIESLSATDLMDACYDATDYPANESCSRITRDGDHQVTFIETGYVNAGFRKFNGLFEGRFDVRRVCVGHRLHDDWRAAADAHVSHIHAERFAA